MKITRELLDRIIKEPEKFQVLEQNPFEVLYDNDELPKVFREDLVNDKYNKRLVILDTETTGFNYTTDDIIELAFVVVTFNFQHNVLVSIDDYFDEFCEPTKEITKHITEITGITPAMVAGKTITIDDVKPHLPEKFLMVAHNAEFDRKFVDKKFPDLKNLPWADSLTEIDWGAKGFTKHSLEALMYKMDMFYTAHRAINDVLALLYVIVATNSVLEMSLSASKMSVDVEVDVDFAHKDLVKSCGFKWVGEHKTWKRNYRKMNDWTDDKKTLIEKGAKLNIVEIKLVSARERYTAK